MPIKSFIKVQNWTVISDVLCTFISLNVQSAAARGYCLSKTEFNKVLSLFDEFVA